MESINGLEFFFGFSMGVFVCCVYAILGFLDEITEEDE